MILRTVTGLVILVALAACSATRQPANSSVPPDAFLTGKCFPESSDTVALGVRVPEVGPEPPPTTLAKAPDYPLPLLTANLEGYVIATFVIDSVGRPPLGQIVIDRSTHPQFSSAVCRALMNFRFKPHSETHPTAVIAKGVRFEFAIVGR